MDVQKILAMLPDELLDDLADQTEVNKYSKKLKGQLVFKLLLHCILSHKDNSLRTMESAYESIAFGLLNANRKKGQVRYSSISERLSSINPGYFEKIYRSCIGTYGKVLSEKAQPLVRFDSTIVALSTKLLKVGYHIKGGDANHVHQLKFTIGLDELPVCAEFYHAQTYSSEDPALRESILKYKPDRGTPIRVFDRGISARKTYDAFTESKIPFISRLKVNSKMETCSHSNIVSQVETDTLTIYSDTAVYLFSEGCRKAKLPVRCIKAKQKDSGEEIVFVSNIFDLTATEITAYYKQRWDIEVFFKFLKQELNFSHLINRSENGIKVMLYATLIAAILLLVYKKKNGLIGYKIMKQRFVQDLEKSLVKSIVEMCGGNPDLIDKLLNLNTS
jgi:hypothetical protein